MSCVSVNCDSFPDFYVLLSKAQKRIFLKIQHYCRKFSVNFISHDLLAKESKCCRRTVVRAIEAFTKYGWITVEKRAYRSNVYRLPDYLLNFDLHNQENFRNRRFKRIDPQRENENVTQNVTENVTLLYKRYSKGNRLSQEESSSPLNFSSEERQLWDVVTQTFDVGLPTFQRWLRKFDFGYLTHVLRSMNLQYPQPRIPNFHAEKMISSSLRDNWFVKTFQGKRIYK